VVQPVAGANRRWRGQFRYRGSRRESAVAQLVRRRYHESIIYHAADLRVDEFACRFRAFSHDGCSSPRSREFSRAHDFRCRCILCRLALSGVLVASTLAGIFAKMVQPAFVCRQHFLCAGSFRFCYWLSMTTTPNEVS